MRAEINDEEIIVEEPALDLREFAQVLLRRRWWFLATFVAIVGGVAAYTLLRTPIYRSETKLLVNRGELGENPGIASTLMPLMELQEGRSVDTQIELIKSELIMVPAREAVGLPPRPTEGKPGPEVTVSTVMQTNIVNIACYSPDRALASKLANEIADQYVAMTLERNRRTASQSRKFVKAQWEKAAAELEAAEERLKGFRQRTGITAADEATGSLMERLGAQREQLSEIEAAVASDKAEIAALKEELQEGEEFVTAAKTVTRNPVVDELRSSLAELEARRARLSTEYAPTSRELQSLQEEIERVRKKMAQEADRIVSSESQVAPVRQEIMRELALSEIRLLGDIQRQQAIRDELRKTQMLVDRLPADQLSAAKLERSLRIAEENYMRLTRTLADLRLAEESKIPSASIVEEARPAESAVIPDKKKNAFLGILLGAILGLIAALTANHLDDTYATAQEIEERTGLPVLATLHELEADERKVLRSPLGRTAFAESFRMIRTAFGFSAVKHPVKTVLVTSVGAGEGKSLVCVNTAIACAEAGRRVVLVDGDLRQPRIQDYLNIDSSRGLTNSLTDGVDPVELLESTRYDNLEVLASGPLPPNVGELLDSGPMQNVTGRLSDYADLVLIDSPPATILADARLLARLSDAVLFVLDARQTRRDAFERLISVFKREEHVMPGIVVNKATREPGTSYYYYTAEEYHEEIDESGAGRDDENEGRD